MEITLQGSLGSFKLPEVLSFIHMSGKTGSLNLIEGDRDVWIYFDSGGVVFATSKDERFRLGGILMRNKKISSAQWKQIEEMMLQQGEKFGKIAVDQGLLSEEELHLFLKIQVSEIIYDCFTWTGGSFSFWDELKLPPHAVTISIDLTNLIMEGARRIDEIDYFSELLPDKKTVLRVVGDPHTSQEQINLSLAEWKILFLIDGRRTFEQICDAAPAGLLDVYRVIYGLFANKLLEIVSEEEATMNLIHEAEVIPISEVPTDKMYRVDTGFLISPEANLTIKDVLKVTLASLTWKRSAKDSQTFPLIDQEYFIGRQLGNAIHIPDPSVSNVHARIFKGPEGYVLEDLKSRNGTFINGTRIDSQLLVDNDSVRFGNSNFVYSIVFEVQPVPDRAGGSTQ